MTSECDSIGEMSIEMVIIIELFMCGYLLRAPKNSSSNYVLNAKTRGLGSGIYLVQVTFLLVILLLSQQGIAYPFLLIIVQSNGFSYIASAESLKL